MSGTLTLEEAIWRQAEAVMAGLDDEPDAETALACDADEQAILANLNDLWNRKGDYGI